MRITKRQLNEMIRRAVIKEQLELENNSEDTKSNKEEEIRALEKEIKDLVIQQAKALIDGDNEKASMLLKQAHVLVDKRRELEGPRPRVVKPYRQRSGRRWEDDENV